MFTPALSYPQEATNEEQYNEAEIIVLPEASIEEALDTPDTVTREELERNNANDLWEAVRYVPGVILSGGGRRGESNFTVRGFGADDVPIYVDGVLMANPYRGEGDAARFLTGDLESIEIQKGFSTSLLGANTLGGAVLMRTAKPKKPLELMARTGFDFDSAMRYADSNTTLGAGTKLKTFYGKVMLQYRDVDHFRLPDNFEPTIKNPQQKGERLFSNSDDLKLSFLAGITPLDSLDMWFTYTFQNAHKGVSPPDIRVAESSADFSLWDWPLWKRHSASLNGIYDAGELSLSALIYFDKYDNRLDEYRTIAHYEAGVHAPHSDYDEYSLGGRIIAAWDINERNNLQASLTYKKEDHKGLKGGYSGFPDEDTMTEIIHINEDTWSFGTEYAVKPWKPFTFKAGFGFNALVPVDYWGQENEFSEWILAGYYIVKSRTMFLYTWQAGVFYDINDRHKLSFTYARKNHFPNMSQRYSTRFGKNLPNPKLGPELANHFELGYGGSVFNISHIKAALYYSLMSGKIVDVQIPDPDKPSYELNYARNLDSTSFYGVELSPDFFINDYFSGGLSFSLNGYSLNHSQNDEVTEIPYYPLITISAYTTIKPLVSKKNSGFRSLSVIPRIEYISDRYNDSAGEQTLDGYFLIVIKCSAELGNNFTLSFSVDNILDTFYEIRYNSPMAGRVYNISLTAKY